VGMSLTEIWETCSTDQRHETGRLKHTRTEDTTKARNKHIVQYARYPKKRILTKCSNVQVIHCIF